MEAGEVELELAAGGQLLIMSRTRVNDQRETKQQQQQQLSFPH